MAKKKRPEDLSERELHRLLIQKRRKSRRKRLDDFRRSGRIVEISPIPETKNQETKIQADLNAIQNQLLALKNKKELLSARQNSSFAKGVMEKNQGYQGADAEDIFQRWEETVTGTEFNTPETMEVDNLASGFEQEEDAIELKMMLDELTQKPTSSESE